MDRNRAVNILNFVIFLFVPNYVSNGMVEIYSWPLFTLVRQGEVNHIFLVDLIPYVFFSVVLLIGIFVSIPSIITFQYYIRVIIMNVMTIIFLIGYHLMILSPGTSFLIDFSILKYYYFGLFLILIINISLLLFHFLMMEKL